jgi:hypothetical protein
MRFGCNTVLVGAPLASPASTASIRSMDAVRERAGRVAASDGRTTAGYGFPARLQAIVGRIHPLIQDATSPAPMHAHSVANRENLLGIVMPFNGKRKSTGGEPHGPQAGRRCGEWVFGGTSS